MSRQLRASSEHNSAPGASVFLEPFRHAEAPVRVWLDVGAHLGEKTFSAAQHDAGLRVYAFEPNLALACRRMGHLANFIVLPVAVAEEDGSAEFYLNSFDAASSILPMNPAGRARWLGGEELTEVSRCRVPTMRLDTFLNAAGIRDVEFLKIDAQGADLAVIRSAGERLRDIRKVSLEVQINSIPLYQGASEKLAVIRYMEEAGFQLVSTERQSFDQEENLTFERQDRLSWADESEAIERAKALAFLRPIGPYPGWTFAADWDNPNEAFRERRHIWEYFCHRRLEIPFVFDWYECLKVHLYLGNDFSRQLFIAGCAEPNEFAFLNEALTSGMVFVDGGANEGLYTLFASRRVGAHGAVLSFEPSQREFDRLAKNISLNDLANVRLFRAALADQNGESDLHIAGYEHEGQNTLGEFVHEGVALERTERVALCTLDNVVAGEHLTRLDVLKLDVEGAEFRVLLGARQVLQKFRPIVIFEVVDAALQKQGGSIEQIREFLGALHYRIFAFDRDGCPAPAQPGVTSDNMIAVPLENPLADQLASRPSRGFQPDPLQPEVNAVRPQESSFMPSLTPAHAYWNQRSALADARGRILALSDAVNHRTDLLPFQWAQLMSMVMEYQPDLIMELGRGRGNSTCAFTEACHRIHTGSRVLSLCLSDDWERVTVPRLRPIVPPDWFQPLQVLRTDILEFDYEKALSGAKRVVLFWDAHGFEIAECVLGAILPILADKQHVVIMHDLSDSRYGSDELFDYGEHGLWKGNNWSGPRLKLGFIDSAVEQSIAALDFTTRNHLTLDSADHSFRTELTPQQQSEMKDLLGELFDLQGHWFYFSLNERRGPYRFPRFTRPSLLKETKARP